ncbi:hypothetical protein D9757_005456 [Collybiopsis confluens]|uniref:6-phosphogluconate dehydrogenase C-terminal domain-like protein n=1 Tax=Collybiopsis confluens TaxID=2823264 RepID=A0A8H5M9I8_9AGAR|nr:hypothetical protein D9757_005456 [Collybiopsis confluens]
MAEVKPTIAVIGAGEMGSKMALRMLQEGASILTNLDGRSPETWKRARDCGMQQAPYSTIVSEAHYILSVVPPKDALSIARLVVDAAKVGIAQKRPNRRIIFADLNAISPETAKQMGGFFVGTGITFIDGAIIGGPPSEVYNPGIYLCADRSDEDALDELEKVSKECGLKPFTLKGEGSGIGDASAVKMANAGIVKGTIALLASMILASHATSPSTATALLHSLHISQSTFLDQMSRLVPQMTPKAYRFVGEMQEVAKFVGRQPEGDAMARLYESTAQIFQRIAKSKEEKPGDGGDVDVLLAVAEEARKLWETDKGFSWGPPPN